MREPFSGYKLSSGHFIVHMAYLIGSIISTRFILTDAIVKHEFDVADPNDVLF